MEDDVSGRATIDGHTWRFVRALVATNLRASMAQRGAFLAHVLLMILNNLVFFAFWWLFFRRVPNVRGWTMAEVELLFGLSASSFGLVVSIAGGVRYLGQ